MESEVEDKRDLACRMSALSIQALGESINIGYDCAYPINDHFALGFYVGAGLGYWAEFKKYSSYDHMHTQDKEEIIVSLETTSAGLMLRACCI